jgi:hypothetical protein
MTNVRREYRLLAGDAEYGPIVHDGAHVIYWRYPSAGVVGNIVRASVPFTPQAMVGFNTRVQSGRTVVRGAGLIICNGRSVAYLLRYSDRNFKLVEPAPFEITGITGDTFYGIVAYGGRRVAYLRHFDGHWRELPNAPFDIEGITGQNRGGVAVYTGPRIAWLGNYNSPKWTLLAAAPFSIEDVTGGVRVDGSRIWLAACSNTRIASLTASNPPSKGAGEWDAIDDAPFPVRSLSGSAESGIVALSAGRDALARRVDERWESISRDSSIVQTSSKRIWANKGSKGQYQAFTDLKFFEGTWYCCFRQGKTHLSKDGAIYVLRSKNGETWQPALVIEDSRYDFRDPHMFIMPGKGNRQPALWLTCYRDSPSGAAQTVTCSTRNGQTWSAMSPIGPANVWLWRTTWSEQQDIGLSVGYVPGGRRVSLYSTSDGKRYTLLREDLYTSPSGAGIPSEHAMAYHLDGTAYCLLRRDAPDGKHGDALIGVAAPPYQEWRWNRSGVKVGGPELLRLADGRIVAACRRYVQPDKWAPAYLQFATTILPPEFADVDYRPMGRIQSDNEADIGYAGMVEKDGYVWFSYYCGVVPNVHVYVARVIWPARPAV